MKKLPRRGMALITALVLMVMMTTIAINLFTRLAQQTSLATLEQHDQQARWYLASAESLALATLRQSLAKTSRVYLQQPWATMTHRYVVPQGTITATLSDAESCFNLNALANSDPQQQRIAREQLSTLLSRLAIPATRVKRFTAYLGQFFPSQNAQHILLVDISELRAADGIDAGLYQKLKPLLCALPQTSQRININSLHEEQSVILEALFAPWLSASQARTLIQQRPASGWESVGQFLNAGPLAKVDDTIKTQLKNTLSVESHYFLLRAGITFAGVRLVSRSLISRAADKQFSILWHQTGDIE